MEIRARYVLVGVFVLVVILGAAGFIYWLYGFGGFNDRTTYAVRFGGPVSGLVPGSEVSFNGISVGEVTSLGLDPQKPSDVLVTIAVRGHPPLRSDTQAGLAFSGLTGAATIALVGGSNTAPPLAPGNPPLITADNAARQDLTSAARQTLNDINAQIDANADSVHSAISSIDTFAQALSRNADKVDAIIAGLSQLAGGGPAMDYALHDLPAPKVPLAAKLPEGQLVVARPTAVVSLATQRILIVGPHGDVPVFDEVRWADTLPIIVQSRTIEAFENAGDVKVVSDAGLASGDFSLSLDLRQFHIVPGAMSVAEVSFAAKLLDGMGNVIDGKTFSDSEPVARTDDSATAIAGLSAAFGKASTELTAWALAAMVTAEAAAPSAPPTAPALGPAARVPLA